MITVKQAECHETCLDVVGDGEHRANVNPIGGTDLWRVDCETCFTCIRSNLATKQEALEAAKLHVKETR